MRRRVSDAIDWLMAELGGGARREPGLGEQALSAVAGAARAAGRLLPL